MGLLPWVSSVEEAEDYARLAEGLGASAVRGRDQGGHRHGPEGVLRGGLAGPAARRSTGCPALRLAGMVTHLPSPDEDAAFTSAQLASFDAAGD